MRPRAQLTSVALLCLAALPTIAVRSPAWLEARGLRVEASDLRLVARPGASASAKLAHPRNNFATSVAWHGFRLVSPRTRTRTQHSALCSPCDGPKGAHAQTAANSVRLGSVRLGSARRSAMAGQTRVLTQRRRVRTAATYAAARRIQIRYTREHRFSLARRHCETNGW